MFCDIESASAETVALITSIEDRADLCLQHFALRTVPRDKATWTILSSVIHQLEETYARSGPDSAAFRAAMVNLARHALMLIRWLGDDAPTAGADPFVPRWDSLIGGRAFRDLRIVANYDAFLSSYPMWHRNRLGAILLSDNVVRFQTPLTAAIAK